MIMYLVGEDGELKETPFRKESIDSKNVYLFVNDDEKLITLWNGKEARTRSKFIGARLASSLRLEHGLSYKLVQVDESENPDFVKRVEVRPGARPSATPATTTVRPEPSSPPRAQASSVQPRQQSSMAGSQSSFAARGSFPASKSDMDQGRIVERLNGIEIPKGFERELIVIGYDMFAVSVSKTKVFGKEKVEYKVGKVTNPVEDGIFLAEGYTPRVIIENGRVLAVEFLKGASQPQKKAGPERASAKEATTEEPLESLMEKHLSEITTIFKDGAKREGDREK